jgi:hypothetical protein
MNAPEKIYCNREMIVHEEEKVNFLLVNNFSVERLDETDIEYLSASAVAKMLQEARNKALEEAAREYDKWRDPMGAAIAKGIRSLKYPQEEKP